MFKNMQVSCVHGHDRFTIKKDANHKQMYKKVRSRYLCSKICHVLCSKYILGFDVQRVR